MVEGCERILARSPEHPASRRELALARRMKNDWAGVTEILEPLMAAAGDGNARLPAEDQALWVEAAYRQGRLEDAARVGLTLADELAGESGFMLLMIDVLRDLKDHAGAYRIYEKASRAMPDDPRLKRLARRIDFDRKRQRLDELSLRPIEALSPDEHYEAAELYREFGQHEQAIIHYQKAACEEELALPATGSMAVVMCECGMYDLAAETLEPIELTREIDQRHPELKEMFYSVGRAMERHKRFDQSVVFYKRVFRVDASFRDVVDRLQRLG
jgi:tetratricopeptide (TPR) repeat protein